MAAKKKAAGAGSWFGEGAACETLGNEVRARGAWGDETDARFQEYVAREHLDGGMPIIELHRNHGISLSAVKRWISTYEQSGREGLEELAAQAALREQKRIAKVLAQKPDPKLVAELTSTVESSDLSKKRAAYAIIGKKRLSVMVPTIVAAIRKTKSGYSIQDELELLAKLRAKEALTELAESSLPIMKGYDGWMEGFIRTAGKP